MKRNSAIVLGLFVVAEIILTGLTVLAGDRLESNWDQ